MQSYGATNRGPWICSSGTDEIFTPRVYCSRIRIQIGARIKVDRGTHSGEATAAGVDGEGRRRAGRWHGRGEAAAGVGDVAGEAEEAASGGGAATGVGEGAWVGRRGARSRGGDRKSVV